MFLLFILTSAILLCYVIVNFNIIHSNSSSSFSNFSLNNHLAKQDNVHIVFMLTHNCSIQDILVVNTYLHLSLCHIYMYFDCGLPICTACLYELTYANVNLYNVITSLKTFTSAAKLWQGCSFVTDEKLFLKHLFGLR